MEAHEKSFAFMSASSYYDIPFFQRAYVWDEENWAELLDNFFDQTDSHFLGSIILKQEHTASGEHSRYLIIDGQQRLTTLSILTRACYDRLIEEKDQYPESITDKFRSQLHQLLFLAPDMFAEEEVVKIQHSKLDAPDFQSVINGNFADCIEDGKYNKKYDKETGKIIRCYLYFRKELHSHPKEDIQKLWKLLTTNESFYLVNIDLGAEENEQKIFDTVNSFGVRLSSSDTIKNAVFQEYIESLHVLGVKDGRKKAAELYGKTWEKVFEGDEESKEYWETTRRYGRMSRDNMEVFLNSFAVINGFYDPAVDYMAELPQKYKKYIAGKDKNDIEDFLNSVNRYAEVYKTYFSNFDADSLFTFSDFRIRLLHLCHVLDVATFYPYILKLLYQNEVEKTLSEEELKDIFLQLERYIVLNAICGGSTKNYNNECVQLIRGRKTPDELRDSSSYISKNSFVNGLLNMKLNKIPTVILFWIELFNRETQYSDIKDLKYDYTLEHIMPQKWEKNWSVTDVPVKDGTGEVVEDEKDARDIRSKAVYEIGNMTLLNSKLNTAVSNGTFYTKVNGDGKKYKHCMRSLADLYLTRDVIKEHTWDESKIYARTDKLMNSIKEIWQIEFEEDKQIHLDLDKDDLRNEYLNHFRGMSLLDTARDISRSDASDEMKCKLMQYVYEEYSGRYIQGFLTLNKGLKLDKDTEELLNLICPYAYGKDILILFSVFDKNEEKCLKEAMDSLAMYEEPIHEEALYVGVIELVKNRFDGFYGKLKDALKTKLCDPEVNEILGIMDKYYECKTSEEKVELLEPLSKKYTNSILVNSLLGYELYQLKKWEEAIHYLDAVASDEKNYGVLLKADLFFYLGYAYSRIGKHKDSADRYEKSLACGLNSTSYNNLGYEYYLLKDYEQALRYYDESIKMDSSNIYAANNKANVLIALKKYDELESYIADPPHKLRKDTLEKAKQALQNR